MECRAGTIYLRASLEWMAGLYRFFCSVFVVVDAVRLKWWGVVWLSFHFLYLVVSFSGGQLSVVGFLCYILRFSSVNLWIFRAVLCFERY